MDSRIASFRESIDTDMCAGPQMELFDEILSLDNDLLLNSKPMSIEESSESSLSIEPDSLAASPDIGEANPLLVDHGEYIIDLGGWEIKPWSFAQDMCFQTMPGWHENQSGWFQACQAISASPLSNSEKLFEYLTNKESIIRLLHKVTLDVLTSTIEMMQSNDKLLRALSPSELYGQMH